MSVATPEPAVAAAHGCGVLLPLPQPSDPDGRPALRLLPAPPCEPPYDDELPHPSSLPPVARSLPGVAGSTALATAPPPETVVLRLVPPPACSPAAVDDDDATPRTPLVQLPASRPFAHALVQRLLEVLAGLRPVSQLQRDTSFELYTELEETLAGSRRTVGPRPSRRDVRSVHVQEHEEGVAEVCATVRRGGRVSALALRLEGVDGGWRCTALLGL